MLLIGHMISLAGGFGATAQAGAAVSRPAAFDDTMWEIDATPSPGGDILVIDVSALPGDGGAPLTRLEYRVDAGAGFGAEQTLSGPETGGHEIVVPTGTEVGVQLRAANSEGPGRWSDVKTATPTVIAAPADPLDGYDPAANWTVFDATAPGAVTHAASPATGNRYNVTAMETLDGTAFDLSGLNDWDVRFDRERRAITTDSSGINMPLPANLTSAGWAISILSRNEGNVTLARFRRASGGNFGLTETQGLGQDWDLGQQTAIVTIVNDGTDITVYRNGEQISAGTLADAIAFDSDVDSDDVDRVSLGNGGQQTRIWVQATAVHLGAPTTEERQKMEGWLARKGLGHEIAGLVNEDGAADHPYARKQTGAIAFDYVGPQMARGTATTLADRFILKPSSEEVDNIAASAEIDIAPDQQGEVSWEVDLSGLSADARVRVRVHSGLDLGGFTQPGLLAETVIHKTNGNSQSGTLGFEAWGERAFVSLYVENEAASDVKLGSQTPTWAPTLDDHFEATVSVSVVPDTVAIGATATVSSVTHNGVTFTFNKPAKVGRYVDGSYWALNADGLAITSITPEYRMQTAAEAAYGDLGPTGVFVDGTVNRALNGAVRNWRHDMVGGIKPFEGMVLPDGSAATSNEEDSSVAVYKPVLNVDPALTGQPIVIAPGEEATITKSVSREDCSGLNFRLRTQQIENLTVVTTEPAAGDFRPWTGAASKASPANIADLDLTPLPSLPVPASYTADAWPYEGGITRGVMARLARVMRAGGSMKLTGQNNLFASVIGTRGEALVPWDERTWAALADPNTSAADAEDMAIGFVQRGLDTYALSMAGERGTFEGVNNCWKPYPVLAAVLLDDATMKANLADGTAWFPEDAYISLGPDEAHHVGPNREERNLTTRDGDYEFAPDFQPHHIGIVLYGEPGGAATPGWSEQNLPLIGGKRGGPYIKYETSLYPTMRLIASKVAGFKEAWARDEFWRWVDYAAVAVKGGSDAVPPLYRDPAKLISGAYWKAYGVDDGKPFITSRHGFEVGDWVDIDKYSNPIMTGGPYMGLRVLVPGQAFSYDVAELEAGVETPSLFDSTAHEPTSWAIQSGQSGDMAVNANGLLTWTPTTAEVTPAASFNGSGVYQSGGYTEIVVRGTNAASEYRDYVLRFFVRPEITLTPGDGEITVAWSGGHEFRVGHVAAGGDVANVTWGGAWNAYQTTGVVISGLTNDTAYDVYIAHAGGPAHLVGAATPTR